MHNKKTKLDYKRKPLYSTDNRMYGTFSILIIIAIVLAVASLRVISRNGSVLLQSDIVGLLSGVLSGVLASVIVAWLLDLATCRRKNKMLKKAMDADLADLKMWLDELFQAMRDSLSSQDCQKGVTIDTLFQLFVEQQKTNKNTEILEGASLEIYVNINNIIAMIDKLTTGEEKEFLVTVYDDAYPFLVLNKSMFDFRENIFNNGNMRYDFIYSGIIDFLSTVLLYVDLLKKEYNAKKTVLRDN